MAKRARSPDVGRLDRRRPGAHHLVRIVDELLQPGADDVHTGLDDGQLHGEPVRQADVVGVHPGHDRVPAGGQPGVQRRARARRCAPAPPRRPEPGWPRPAPRSGSASCPPIGPSCTMTTWSGGRVWPSTVDSKAAVRKSGRSPAQTGSRTDSCSGTGRPPRPAACRSVLRWQLTRDTRRITLGEPVRCATLWPLNAGPGSSVDGRDSEPSGGALCTDTGRTGGTPARRVDHGWPRPAATATHPDRRPPAPPAGRRRGDPGGRRPPATRDPTGPRPAPAGPRRPGSPGHRHRGAPRPAGLARPPDPRRDRAARRAGARRHAAGLGPLPRRHGRASPPPTSSPAAGAATARTSCWSAWTAAPTRRATRCPTAVLAQLHSGPDTGVINSDTIILLHVPADGGAAVAFSIPRDSYVYIPGHGRDKINAAYPAVEGRDRGAAGGRRARATRGGSRRSPRRPAGGAGRDGGGADRAHGRPLRRDQPVRLPHPDHARSAASTCASRRR